MALWQGNSVRKPTGGRFVRARGKRRFEIAREVLLPIIGINKFKLVRTKGANQKIKTLTANTINVTNQGTGKTSPASIKTVVSNPTNLNYVRRNILTKGAVVETSAGKVRITSRPGQHGALSGVLVE